MKRREHLAPAPAALPPSSQLRPDSGVRERTGPTNLAHSPTRFVGRRREMSELRTLLTEHPLVTVLGPAGVAKTRLPCGLPRPPFDESPGEGRPRPGDPP